MKLGFHGATTMKADLATDIKVSAAAGFKGLELQYGKIRQYLTDHSLTDLRQLFKQYAIEPTSINTLEFIGFREDYSQLQTECRQLSQIAEAIGCTLLVTIPSPTPRTYKGQPELNYPWDDMVKEYVGVFQDLSGIAERYNVRMAFEFLGFGWCKETKNVYLATLYFNICGFNRGQYRKFHRHGAMRPVVRLLRGTHGRYNHDNLPFLLRERWQGSTAPGFHQCQRDRGLPRCGYARVAEGWLSAPE